MGSAVAQNCGNQARPWVQGKRTERHKCAHHCSKSEIYMIAAGILGREWPLLFGISLHIVRNAQELEWQVLCWGKSRLNNHSLHVKFTPSRYRVGVNFTWREWLFSLDLQRWCRMFTLNISAFGDILTGVAHWCGLISITSFHSMTLWSNWVVHFIFLKAKELAHHYRMQYEIRVKILQILHFASSQTASTALRISYSRFCFA